MELYKNKDILEIKNLTDFINITWYMTGWCNYSCPYCINSQMRCPWIDESIIINRAININKLLNNNFPNNKISLKLLGGEVTYYNLQSILDKISKLNKVSLITNLSQPIEYFIDLAKYLDKREIKFVLICSKHEQNKDFDTKFITLSKKLRELNTLTGRKFAFFEPQLNVVVDDNFDWSKLDIFVDNKITKINPTIKRNLDETNVTISETTLNKIKYFKDLQEKFVLSKNPKLNYHIKLTEEEKDINSPLSLTNYLDNNGFMSNGFMCSAGINTLAILPDGKISRCNCPYLSDKPIGSIDDNPNIKLELQPIKCNLDSNHRCILVYGNNVWKEI